VAETATAVQAHRKYKVLFLCTGNSARSILAEAALNHLPVSRSRFVGYSAGSHPKGEPNPYALELLEKTGIPTAGLRSKSWDEFAQPGAPELDFIFTVCDEAAGEQCPYWPGKPMTAHWGMPDPAAVKGSPDEIRHAFTETLLTLRRRIELFASLPLDKLDRLAIEKHARDIAIR
jgi:arsenate reductase (thioredoxin)